MDFIQQVKNYILEQLWVVYNQHETYISTRIDKETFFRYTQQLIDQGNIFYVCDKDRVVGYTEVWKINYEQFGRLVCGEDIAAVDEDVTTGKLAYVANIWIDPEYRKGFGTMDGAIKTMRKMYYAFTADVDYHCGTAQRKQAQLIKVFKAKLLKGEKYGKL